ncbi:jacalin-related lectin 3 [Carica papaya]|uniref:jacalin-related lectin 3 n=1 Tax=Carica papaya TaxID=3649 RepID=UPI000B8CC3AE|nr:jacalin-related lectin 3 [Carica papaya]
MITTVDVEDMRKQHPVSSGPCGGGGGSRWDDGIYSGIRQIVITHGACIDSIQIEYEKDGRSVWSKKHGGNGGNNTDTVKLDYPDEFLSSIGGKYGSQDLLGGPEVIRSLVFESNRRKYGPFGIEQGKSFLVPREKEKIVGLHGRCGWYVDAIGVYSLMKPEMKSSKTLVQSNSSSSFSVIQGSVAESYDIVLAVRQKDLHAKPSPSIVLSRQSSGSQDCSSDEVAAKTPKVVSKEEGVITYGPWGGNGGLIFNDGVYSGIRQVNLSRNIGIVSIKVCYDHDGQAIWGSKHGGTGGFRSDKIIFDYPSEILTHITGTYGPLMYMGPNVIKSLTFHTNKGKHGPYGEEQGPTFSNKINQGKIVGFHGKEGLFLDAIGVYVKEAKITPLNPSSYKVIEGHVAEIQNSGWSNKLVLAKPGAIEEVSCGVVKEPAPCGPGPWGGDGGRPWDDGVFSGIKQIFVTRSSDAISSIQIEYDRNGQSVWSVKHGGNAGVVTHRVKLNYPHEVLSCICGYYGAVSKEDKSNVIKSITFYSSRGKYGPFGQEKGTFFTSTTTEGKVVGFHGRSSLYLDAIGVHMQHWLGNYQKSIRHSLFKFF